jgi:hypothetical protein
MAVFDTAEREPELFNNKGVKKWVE